MPSPSTSLWPIRRNLILSPTSGIGILLLCEHRRNVERAIVQHAGSDDLALLVDLDGVVALLMGLCHRQETLRVEQGDQFYGQAQNFLTLTRDRQSGVSLVRETVKAQL